MCIGDDGPGMCRYLAGVSPYRAFHVTGTGVNTSISVLSLEYSVTPLWDSNLPLFHSF
jgi:hypothetical protein